MITDSNRYTAILRNYGISSDAMLGRGMEATTYRYDAVTVLKIYHRATTLAHLQTLQTFYATLDTRAVSYALPYIEHIAINDGVLVSLERFVPGKRMWDTLRTEDVTTIDDWIRIALNALLELRTIQQAQPWNRYKLFDDNRESLTEHGDWNAFLIRYLTRQLALVGSIMERDVSDFAVKVQRLRERLSQPYTNDYGLIHGDFFPGNLLVDDTRAVSGVLDFGLLTMWGDPLFDIATSWVFFDMYDELHAHVWERYRRILQETLDTTAFSTLATYILFYSIISANTYDSQCADGHYAWCVANLHNPVYWSLI